MQEAPLYSPELVCSLNLSSPSWYLSLCMSARHFVTWYVIPSGGCYFTFVAVLSNLEPGIKNLMKSNKCPPHYTQHVIHQVGHYSTNNTLSYPFRPTPIHQSTPTHHPTPPHLTTPCPFSPTAHPTTIITTFNPNSVC